MTFMARDLLMGSAGNGVGITSPSHPDLVAMYTMDNISGSTLVDESTNGNDGVITGATAVSGKIDNALSFDGVNDVVTSSTSDVLFPAAGFSVSTWLQQDFAGGASFVIFSAAVHSGTGFVETGPNLAIKDDGTLDCQLRTGNAGDRNQEISSTGLFSSNTWVHAVFSFDGTAYKGYLDNVEVISHADASNYTPGARLVRMFANAPAGPFGKGLWDQYRVFNRALTVPEINELYNGGAGA